MRAFEFVSGLFTCVSLGLSMRASMSVRAFECLWSLKLIYVYVDFSEQLCS